MPSRAAGPGPGKRAVAVAVAEARLFAPGVEVSGCIQPGSAVDVLVDASAGASLLVVGSRRLSRLPGSLTGSVGVQVSAQAHCPAVVVRGAGEANGPVVVAVDGSQTSEPALRFAFTEAARRHAGLAAGGLLGTYQMDSAASGPRPGPAGQPALEKRGDDDDHQ